MIKVFYLICLISSLPVIGQNLNYIQTCINKQCFDARIADNPASRTKGLMGEVMLPENEGMLFIFPSEGTPEFWMKDTKIPLDILFINDLDIVVYMVKNAQPCKSDKCPVYKTTRRASKVLEINGGLSNKYNLHVGDPVQYFISDDS